MPSARRGASAALARSVDALRHAHLTFWWLMEDVPLRGFDAARSSGPNDPTWLVTHLTAYYRFVTVNLGGKPARLSAAHRVAHEAMFDDLTDAASAPSKRLRLAREVALREHRAGFFALVRAAEALTPQACGLPPAGSMSAYASDRLRCVELATWHEGWHTGQLASIRRRLGLPSLF